MIKYLTPRSEEEIRKCLSNNLSPQEKFDEGIKQNIDWLIVDAINENPNVYINKFDLLKILQYSHINVVKKLLDVNFDICKHNNLFFRTACTFGNIEMLNLLLDVGIDVHTDYDYALRSACVCGYAEMAKMLLSRGADLDISYYDTLRRTQNEEIRELLLKNAEKYDKISYAEI